MARYVRARELDVTAAHGQVAARLALVHRDPVGRMLVAQAMTEDLPIVTSDAAIGR